MVGVERIEKELESLKAQSAQEQRHIPCTPYN